MSIPLALFGAWIVFTLRSKKVVGIRLGWRIFGATVALALALPPITNWSTRSLPNHMVAHIVLMFILPLAVVESGLFRRAFHRAHPMLGIASLNVVMLASHVSVVFDAVMEHDLLRTLILEPLYVASGIWFFAIVLRKESDGGNTQLRWQFLAVILTTLVMFVLAMSMSIFTKVAWYESMASMPGMAMPGDFHSQQLAAAILWICGDIWAVPIFVVLVRRVIQRDGSLFSTLDRYSSPSG